MSEILNEKENMMDNGKDKKAIVELARKRFAEAEEAELENRKKAEEDLKIRLGDQWPDDVLQKRQMSGRPALTINKIPQFIRQISNEMRQNKPAIKVYPVDDNADLEIARIYQGLVRNIEYCSNADVAYINAGEGAVEKGFGFFRIITDYVNPLSFDLEIKIKQIPNHFAVLIDPYAQEVDGSDADYAFVFDEISKDQFYALYPNSKIAQEGFWPTEASDWFTKDGCRIAEYFYKEYKKVKIFQVRDQLGNVFILDQKELAAYQEQGLVYETLNERETLKPVIKWCKINGDEILEETEWLGSWIPIIPVYGSRVNFKGKWHTESVHRYSQDSQRMLNYMVSAEAEAIGLAPKAPFIVEEGQIPDQYRKMWKTANTEAHAYLVYKGSTVNGQLAPPPQRQAFEPAVMAITNARVQASDDIKATTGIYDASLGARSNEQSGVAIQRRNAQAQTSNYHFIDNLARSIQHAGRIIVELIPKIYDTARVLRIIGEDGEQEVIAVNKEFEKNGKVMRYDLNRGKYDVVVDVGPSYETKRQEAAATMVEMTKAYPQLMQIAGDLMLRNMDFPQAQEIASRFKKTIQPNLLDNSDDEIPPQAAAQMQQMSAVIEQMTAKLNEQSEIIKNKTMEIESKERIEFAKMQNQSAIEMAKINHSEALEALRMDQEMIRSRLEYLDMNEEIDEDLEAPVGNEADVELIDNQQGQD